MKTFKCFKGQFNSPKYIFFSFFTHFPAIVHIICRHCFPFPVVFNKIPVQIGHVCEVAKRTNTHIIIIQVAIKLLILLPKPNSRINYKTQRLQKWWCQF